MKLQGTGIFDVEIGFPMVRRSNDTRSCKGQGYLTLKSARGKLTSKLQGTGIFDVEIGKGEINVEVARDRDI